MDEFTKFTEIFEPDDRNSNYVITDKNTGESRYLTFNDIYERIKDIELDEIVPDSIRSQFNIAKNLAVYSWFEYSFHQISEMKAFSTTEDALKCVLGKNKKGFCGLLKKAVNMGLIKDRGFYHIPKPEDSESIEYSQKLPKLMSNFRNNLAHGGTTIYPSAIHNLLVCRDIINQLYLNRT
ncbi:MAG: hypothetical protein OEY89_14490 [Gammaproteobacteria bacterium]|nr:hypothetical protein [Gammaproteobacteria bacterium]